MAALEAWTAKYPIYKDQGTASNYGKKTVTGDTVTLVIKNDAGAESTIDVVTTDVLDGGRTIQWNPGTTGIRTFDVVRTHQKHEFRCSINDFSATLTEVANEALLMSVQSVTINGGVYAVNVSETGPGADGIPAAFAQAVVDKIQGIIGKEGTVSYQITGSAGSQVLTIIIRGMSVPWTAIAATNATVVQPTIVAP